MTINKWDQGFSMRAESQTRNCYDLFQKGVSRTRDSSGKSCQWLNRIWTKPSKCSVRSQTPQSDPLRSLAWGQQLCRWHPSGACIWCPDLCTLRTAWLRNMRKSRGAVRLSGTMSFSTLGKSNSSDSRRCYWIFTPDQNVLCSSLARFWFILIAQGGSLYVCVDILPRVVVIVVLRIQMGRQTG